MSQTIALPLPLASLPEQLQKFCNPDGPAAARMMAAKGLVPVRGNDQITMLAQLTADLDANVQNAALDSLKKLPETVLATACAAPMHAAVLDLLSRIVSNEEALGALVSNVAASDLTIDAIARTATERVSERIATNEQRLLRSPVIIESLYKNRNTRMSTADRLIELASRNNVELTGIPAFEAHVEALQGQLIPESSDEALPGDTIFQALLAEADSGEDAFETDKFTNQEEVKKQFKPLSMQVADMSKSEKLRLALVGGMAARALLVRDHHKQIAYAAISSPQMTAPEAAAIAKSREVSEEILRFISNKKDWVKTGEVKHNLCFNPKTPVAVSMKFISHLRPDELRELARNRNVSPQLKSLATQWLNRREKSK